MFETVVMGTTKTTTSANPAPVIVPIVRVSVTAQDASLRICCMLGAASVAAQEDSIPIRLLSHVQVAHRAAQNAEIAGLVCHVWMGCICVLMSVSRRVVMATTVTHTIESVKVS